MPDVLRAWAVMVVAALAGPAWGQEPAGAELQPAKYEQLTELVRRARGRVVVVDFWADYCPPCKKAFPHVAALQRKYAAAGLVAVTVSLDDPADADARERARAFAQREGPDCLNLLLDERPEVWQAKLKADGPPCVFVFGRDGTLNARYQGDEATPERVEQRVAELVAPTTGVTPP